MVENIEVQAEFKETEFGIIPMDWSFGPIEKEVDLLTGFPFPSDKYANDGIKLLRGSNVKRGVTDWSYDITKYWESATSDLKQYLLQEGDIVIAMDGSLVGRSFARLSKEDLPALLLQRVARLRSTKIDAGYLKEFVCSEYFTKHCDNVKTASAIPHISPKDIRTFQIPLPPTLAEQTAIATALNDADALITQLEKLIAKKRAIKQGAMQELLKPKEAWEVKRLGEVFESSQSKPAIKSETPVVFLGMEDVSEEGKVLNQHLLPYSQVKKGLSFFRKDNVLVAKITPCFENGKGACLDTLKTNMGFGSTEFHVLQINDKSTPRFVFYHTQTKTFRNQLGLEMTGTAGQKRVPIKSIINYEISLPSLAEQTQIAQTLSDMDTEIEALEKKLAKYQLLKQGMMQNLLTGRIRLV